ncbi:MAG TPA: serine/threonine-protein kinase [Kofleriaceae bacterium]|nr:serine/threonine-protein kinase [Kofleriaceae bacterium]
MHVCGECGQRYERAGFCGRDGTPLGPADDPLLGTEIDRYRLARVLGRGGMGRVYAGVQPAIGSRVAIKVLSDDCARDPELLDRFFAEARAVNLVRHEHIVNVLDMARLPDGRPFIVMEYVDGRTLGQLLREGPLPVGGVGLVMSEVLSALDAAHRIGIVHRDVKPDNILVTVEGHAKVLDFGIAKLAPLHRAGSDAPSPRTRTGALLGTPAYMAPEQISGGAVDARSDVYAAGVVLFEALTGEQPITGATLYDQMRAHLEDAPPSARALRAELPVALDKLIGRALAKRPGDRFATAAAMAAALDDAIAALPVEQRKPLSTRRRPALQRETPPAHSIVRPRRARRRWPLAAGALALAAAATTFALVAIRAAPVASAPVAPPQIGEAVPLAPAPLAQHEPALAAPPREMPRTPHLATAPAPIAGDDGEPGERALAADYDPRRLDVLRYLARAQAIAREVAPDARLVEIDAEPVFPDGHVDLTLATRDPGNYYLFRTERHGDACFVKVRLTATQVFAGYGDPTRFCFQEFVGPPRCSLVHVWAQARTKLTVDAPRATVTYTAAGWLFSGGDITWTFADDCP